MTLDATMTAHESKERKLEFSQPVLVLVEGWPDQRLTAVLLQHIGFGKRVQVHCMKGKDRPWAEALSIARKDPWFMEHGAAVALVQDADSDPQAAERRCLDLLRGQGLPAPSGSGVVDTSGSVRTGVFIMPGRGMEGAVEDLLWDAALDGRREAADSFARTVESSIEKFKTPMKNRVLAYLAAQRRFIESTATAVEVPSVFPPESEGFEDYRMFLSSIASP